jgi:hypothetical protein
MRVCPFKRNRKELIMKKSFYFLPDGVGLRNFAFTSLKKLDKRLQEIVYWNNTVFSLKKKLNFEEVKIKIINFIN